MNGPSEPTSTDMTRSNRWIQFGLLTVLLCTACFAAWLSYYQAQQQTRRYQERLPGLRVMARPFVVDDPTQFVVVQRRNRKYREDVWDVHLPTGGNYRLVLNVRTDTAIDKGETAKHEVRLAAGDHQISVESNGTIDFEATDNERMVHEQIKVLVNDEVKIDTAHSTLQMVAMLQMPFEKSLRQQETSSPLRLIEINRPKSGKFAPPKSPVPAPHTQLWIERIDE